MKPIYLEFCGVNSFSEKAQIDFRALLSGGVFGVFGDTGSGKSTILDCIHLALYGKMERSSGSEYIHYNADQAYVTFDFEITVDGKTRAFRVRRERRRKNNIAKAFLYEYGENNALLALAEGTRDVDDKLEEIIGLTFADFKTCIALPQGDFAALVQAAPSDRTKLISRLFDLEKYGERLSKAVGEKYYKADEECNLVLAKMDENGGCNEETLAAKQAKIKESADALSQAEKALSQADKALQALEKLREEKRAFDALEKALQDYAARLADMEKRQAGLEKIPFAKAVDKDARAVENNNKTIVNAKNRAEIALKNAQTAEENVRLLKEKQAAENYDEQILQVSINRDKVKAAEEDIKAEERANKLLIDSRKEYKEMQAKCKADDFDGKIKALQTELEALGEDNNLLDYLKRNCAEVFAQESYAKFRTDLRILSEKHPMASADIDMLIAKYTPSKTDEENLDVAQMNLAFKALEQKKKALQAQIDEVKNARQLFKDAKKDLEVIEERGKTYLALWTAAKEKVAAVKALGDLSTLENRLSALQTAKESAQKRVDRAVEQAQNFRLEHETQKSLAEQGEQSEQTLLQSLKNSLRESGFTSVEQARELLVKVTDAEKERNECKQFFDGYALAKSKYEETDKAKLAAFDETELARARTQREEKKLVRDSLAQDLADENAEYKLLTEKRKRYLEFAKDLEEKTKRKTLCEELYKLLKGNRFLEFIASEYLQEICVRASKILLSLTTGRYFLRYDKEFKVGDNLDGGNFRAVKTLSGGETFLVSLSLALALSGEICARSRRSMEFFFLDEGFGTLDGKLVDTVMDVLTRLSKEFSVGLISHVEELKHRIENKILVTGANESHGSQIRVVKL